jgi:DNA polymerase-3 subunit gamma/tau
MDNFVVSARKYRPATFDTVVGQESITSTLKNAMNNNHLAQAFLFCGPRGVGKTTCARILAKTINCQNVTDNTEACDNCDSCNSFNEGASLNILELDAASNNSVDDIRHLIDQVRFAPQMGDYKVYIIDEVHMLSQAAFNAFLKTLEEPPKHAIFILATTEKHKIIPTILSRCQIFDFKRIQIEDITTHLQYIAKEEGIEADVEGLSIISQKADGALRDSLSIFDQIVSFSGKTISYQDVIDNLNILDYEFYFRIADAAQNKDISSSLLTFNEILNKGFNGHNFIVGLAEHFRNVLVCKDNATIELLEVGDKTKAKYLDQANSSEQQWLLTCINICNRCDLAYKGSKNQRLQVELALMQLCSIEAEAQKKKFDPFVDTIKLINFKPKNNGNTPSIPINTKQTSEPVKVDVNPGPTAKKVIAIAEPTRKPLTKKVALGGSGFSIKQALTKPEKKESEEVLVDGELIKKHKELFTEAKLIEVWNTYAKKIKAEKKESFYTTLSKYQPKLGENNTLHIELENKVQAQNLNDEKVEMLGYIKEVLKNDFITLQHTIVEKKEGNNLYTNRDKFARMAEINPAMNTLKDKLDLDIDY